MISAYYSKTRRPLNILTPRQKEILQAAECAGLGEGFTVPAHEPGDFNGSCSFGTRYGRAVAPEAIPAAHYLGCFSFEAARRILRLRAATPRTQEPRQEPTLSQRQHDCLVLAAQGKTDWHIGQLLGISEQTVHKHIDAARRQYDSATRAQLIVRALYSNHLTFTDIIR